MKKIREKLSFRLREIELKVLEHFQNFKNFLKDFLRNLLEGNQGEFCHGKPGCDMWFIGGGECLDDNCATTWRLPHGAYHVAVNRGLYAHMAAT